MELIPDISNPTMLSCQKSTAKRMQSSHKLERLPDVDAKQS
jgi:hypothetical protein